MSGVPVTIPGLPAVTPDVADLLVVWDTSAGITGKSALSLLNTIYAQLSGGNAFTGTQGITGALNVDGNVQTFAGALGTGVGRIVRVDRNSSPGTAAPGHLQMITASNATHRVWVDDSGKMRIGTINPDSANITGGVVVGDQTASTLDQKDLVGDTASIEEVLAYVAAGAESVRRFIYKAPRFPIEEFDENGNSTIVGWTEGARPYNGEAFEGLIIDYAPRYGKSADTEHPDGTLLNEITALGDLLRAVGWLVEQNAALVARVAALEGA